MHNLRLIPAKRQLLAAGTLVSLTSAEFSVLQLLMQEAGTVVSKSELTEKVLHRKLSLYDRSIDVHVSRLRQKLQRYGVSGDIIKTIRGQGYLFVKDDV